jgi:hypothetical protein
MDISIPMVSHTYARLENIYSIIVILSCADLTLESFAKKR